jgi:hypothetical protein
MAFDSSQILLIGGILTVLLLSNYCTNELGKNFYAKQETEVKIYDILHENTPDLHNWREFNDLIVVGLIVSAFFIPKPFPIVKEFLGKFLLIMLVRALTIVSTILPKHEQCDPKNTWIQMVKGQCYDKVFSGHMSFVLLATLILLRENIISLSTFFLLNIAQFSSIILTRSHYTVDVILGIVITYLVYDGDYHIFQKYFR